MIVIWILLGLIAAAVAYLLVKRAGSVGRMRQIRRSLQSHLEPLSVGGESLAGLPAPAQRYLRRALPADVPAAPSSEVVFEQKVKKDKTVTDSPFLVYRIREVLSIGRGITGDGWMKGGLPRSVFFWYAQGVGKSREAIFDLVPVILTGGENVSRTLRGRALFELFWLPSAFLPQAGAVWEGVDDERARVTVSLDGDSMPLTLRIDPEGRLLEVTAPRWGSTGTEDRKYTHIPFGMVVDEERTFGGYTIPSRLRGGWWYGTDRYIESIHFAVTGARFQ